MAYTTQQMAAERVRPLHGRNAALDRNGFIVGPVGLREPIDDLVNTATGTSIPNYGLTRITSPVNGGATQLGCAFTLQSPRPGYRKTIYFQGASTSAHVFGLSGGAVIQGGSLTSAGTTMFSMFKQNSCVQLLGITTGTWLMLNSRSSAGVSSDMWGISFSATVSS